MCGIVGIVAPQMPSNEVLANLKHMALQLERRGPDDFGFWQGHGPNIAFGHRRLSILDLSPAGHQPMQSFSKRYTICFNGEIYNYLCIRRDLEREGLLRAPWRGHSDTETLLAAIEAWGLEDTLTRCVGMFALALWDDRNHTLQLARDRFGEKPLYWGHTGSKSNRALVFASELAAVCAWPGFNNEINRPALVQLLRFGAIPAPTCIYSGIYQLLPGHLLTFKSSSILSQHQSQPWWCFRSMVAQGLTEPFGDPVEALKTLEAALIIAVQQQSLSDVPLGSFLSGGIDSSLITALLQAKRNRPVRTFTIGFEQSCFNEAPYARAVAAHLGTEHTEAVLTTAEALALIPQLPQMYSEPFADSSQLPTHLVCREARRSGLTVALSGDGGDELFGGYNRYFWGPRIWNRLAWLPWPLRISLSLAIRSLPPAGWDTLGSALPVHQLGQKAHKMAARLRHVRCPDDLYRSLVSEWSDPAALLQPSSDGSSIQEPSSPLDWPLPGGLSDDPVARMMATDTLNYLPNDILTKVDRAAMAVSLETRAPFLDHRVAEVAWRLPMAMKIHPSRGGCISKWALRQILYKYVPLSLIERPKAGFAIPIGQWLRGPLREWAEDLLEPGLMQRQGYLRPEPIQTLWRQHLSGRFDHTSRLWTVLMWQAWLVEWG